MHGRHRRHDRHAQIETDFNPFDPPPWRVAFDDGTFRGRFDDPRGMSGMPAEQRFRTIYCATQPAGAFGETIQKFPPSPEIIGQFAPSDEPIDPQLLGGIVPLQWLSNRWIGKTVLDPSLHFFDLTAAENLRVLYYTPTLARIIGELGLGLPGIDLSAVTSPHRRLTQEIARYVYNQVDEAGGKARGRATGITGTNTGQPYFAGLRYVSHLNPGWECWAIFHDRMLHTPSSPEVVRSDDPGLREASDFLGLRVEAL